MYKLLHKPTRKFLSVLGNKRVWFLHQYYDVEIFLSKNGKSWVIKKVAEKHLKTLEIFYPKQFELVEFTLTRKEE